MDSRKRKVPQTGLQRRVRARAEPEPDLAHFEDEASSGGAPSEDGVDESGSGSEAGSGSGPESEGAEDPDQNDDESSEEEAGASVDASKISFGALAKAQAALGPRKKKKKKGKASAADGDSSSSDSDSDDDDDKKSPADAMKEWQGGPLPWTKIEKPPSRSSKHAPMEMSSKRQVSRKREIIPVKKVQYRDPRFDPLVTGQAIRTPKDEDHARKAYAFLDEYRDDEVKQVKAAVRKAKTPAEKEELQRALMSMESRKRARERKDKERAVMEEHRRKEKELVREGKKAQPFYLKKSEQKKRLLVDQYSGLSERQRDKAIEKKRKKIAGKEKKLLPMERRARE
ncbi:rRNA biogenesis protein rrp36 [Cytospora paraplurivora]|uniref:rRNA biogenesis protein RRP36 n=1 Tax=Cytospora paraplurivora TaxID=2898453 RepID=A0AAN9YPM9_9PEZI